MTIQTRSPLVLRDLDILKGAKDLEAGLTITTADDKIRRLFEPYATTVEDRLDTLEELHQNGIRTYAMIAPQCFPELRDWPKPWPARLITSSSTG